MFVFKTEEKIKGQKDQKTKTFLGANKKICTTKSNNSQRKHITRKNIIDCKIPLTNFFEIIERKTRQFQNSRKQKQGEKERYV